MKQAPLSEVAEFINGRAFKPEDWQTEGLPIIRIQNLTGSTDAINYYSGEVEPRYLVKNDDILISWSASLGVYKWQGGDAILNQHIFKVELKEKLIDKEYFYYAAHNALGEMERHIHGATMQHITRDPFLAIEIPLPPLAEQKRIASLLARADHLRQLRRTAQELSNTLLQSVFLEMFGDPETNPFEWEKTEIGNVLDVITYGLTVRPEYIENGIPLISAREIRSGVINFDTAPRISEKDFSETYDKGKPQKGDILFSKTGTIGHCAEVKTDEIFAITQNAARLRFKENLTNNAFALQYLRMPFFQDIATEAAKGNAVQDLQLGVMQQFPFYLPPLSLQEEFAGVVARVENLRGRMTEVVRQAEGLFESLLAQSFGDGR